jgi:hypothetical protein
MEWATLVSIKKEAVKGVGINVFFFEISKVEVSDKHLKSRIDIY